MCFHTKKPFTTMTIGNFLLYTSNELGCEGQRTFKQLNFFLCIGCLAIRYTIDYRILNRQKTFSILNNHSIVVFQSVMTSECLVHFWKMFLFGTYLCKFTFPFVFILLKVRNNEILHL